MSEYRDWTDSSQALEAYIYDPECFDKTFNIGLDNKEIQFMLKKMWQALFMNIDLPFKRLHDNATLPAKSGDLEACYDFTCVEDETFIYETDPKQMALKPGQSHVFNTGVAVAIPEGKALYLWDRSGMGAKRNIHRLAGVINANCNDSIKVCLTNLSNDIQYITAGDIIIQGQLALVLPGTPVWQD